MMLETEKPSRRKSQRLPQYDYTGVGAYFVTICVKDRLPLLGKVIGEEVEISVAGKAVSTVWFDLTFHYSPIELDEFIVMPNHIHGIIWIRSESPHAKSVGAGLRPAPTKIRPGLSEVVRAFKSFSARDVNKVLGTSGSFWQRGYYDHIIRDDEDLYQHPSYVIYNPLKWAADEYFK